MARYPRKHPLVLRGRSVWRRVRRWWWRVRARTRCWWGKHECVNRTAILRSWAPDHTGERKERRMLVSVDKCIHCGFHEKVTPLGYLRNRRKPTA